MCWSGWDLIVEYYCNSVYKKLFSQWEIHVIFIDGDGTLGIFPHYFHDDIVLYENWEDIRSSVESDCRDLMVDIFSWARLVGSKL